MFLRVKRFLSFCRLTLFFCLKKSAPAGAKNISYFFKKRFDRAISIGYNIIVGNTAIQEKKMSDSFKNIFIVASLFINISAVFAVRKVEGILSREAEVVEKEKELAKKEMIIKKEFPVANSLDDINIESYVFKNALKAYNIWLDLSLKDKANLKGVNVFSYTISPSVYDSKYFLFKGNSVAIYKQTRPYLCHSENRCMMGRVDLTVNKYNKKKELSYRYQKISRGYGYPDHDWNISLSKISTETDSCSLVRVSKFVNISDI